MKLTVTNQAPTDSLLLKFYSKFEIPDLGNLSFLGEKGEVWWASTNELWVGLGDSSEITSFRRIVRKLFHQRQDRWPAQVTVDVRGRADIWIENIISGILLGGYQIGLYKTKQSTSTSLYQPGSIIYLLTDRPVNGLQQLAEEIRHTTEVQYQIMDLMNAPGNKKSPRTIASWALTSAKNFGYEVKVLDKGELHEQGFHALLAVNQGSDEEPVLIVGEYTPDRYQHTIALVGKGITFDTGGISVKPSSGMHLMKSDMGGAAAVLGITELAARLKLPVRLISIIPSTENCIDGTSLKPGDVISSYAGKSIEVIDTDAEGRLILADGLSYAVRQFQPDTIIDLATLTGSIIQTLGYSAAGLFSNNSQLAGELIKAGNESGEKVWQLPMWEEFEEELTSDIADVKNFHGKPMAGAIVAAKFLEVFTDKHPSWAHLDIAGMAFGDQDLYPGKAGTSFGIRLLLQYLKNLSQNQ